MKSPSSFCRAFLAVAVLALTSAGLGGCLSSSIAPLQPMDDGDAATTAAATQDGNLTTAPTTYTATTAADTAPATDPDIFAATTSPTSEPTTVAATAASEPSTLAATEPGTQPATQLATAPTSQPATQPLAKKIRPDPNQTTRLIYRANYDRVWQQALLLITDLGYRPDRQDYRLGVLTSMPNRGADLLEPWRPDQTGVKSALENTIHSQQRTIRLTIRAVEGKPAYYEIAVQVLVERRSNPTEALAGQMFIEGSGFGHSVPSLRSDYLVPTEQEALPPAVWRAFGHDTALEKKILDLLFKKI